MLYAIFSLLALALLALDQWVKHWITVNLPLGEGMDFLPGLVELRTVHNYGAAWSSFSGSRWLLVVLTSCIVLAVLAVLIRRIVRHPVGVAACLLIVSGDWATSSTGCGWDMWWTCSTFCSWTTLFSTWRTSAWSAAAFWA